jgi:hypothetical protein
VRGDERRRHGSVRRALAAGGAVALCVVALAACSGGSSGSSAPTTTTSSPAPLEPPGQVALFGDSLSGESQPYYENIVKTTGEVAVSFSAFGGFAMCDWLPEMPAVEAAFHPKAVELQFSGNALTACMKNYQPPSQAYYDKYRADTLAAINIFVPGGAHVYLISYPISRSQQAGDPNWNRLNEQYAEIAAADPQHVTFVPAGNAVEGPNHTFTQTLPCLPGEPCEGPVVNTVPSNIVRAPDGAHFCPVEYGNEEGVIAACPVYSSGAFRYAYAMAQALLTSP